MLRAFALSAVGVVTLICLSFLEMQGTTHAEEPPLQQPTTAVYFPSLMKRGPAWTPTPMPQPVPLPVRLKGHQDTWIHSHSPNLPWAQYSNQILVGNERNERYIGLAQFDLRDLYSIPTSIRIESAILIMVLHEPCFNCIDRSFSLSAVKQPWLERETTWTTIFSSLGDPQIHLGEYDATNNQIQIDVTDLINNWWLDQNNHPNYGLAISMTESVRHFKSHRLSGEGGPIIKVSFTR